MLLLPFTTALPLLWMVKVAVDARWLSGASVHAAMLLSLAPIAICGVCLIGRAAGALTAPVQVALASWRAGWRVTCDRLRHGRKPR